MKLYKVFAIGLAALTLTACSDDDKTVWNTAPDVTVEMGQASISVKEGKGLVFVPVKLNGTPNGDVQVIVETIETGNNPAKEQLSVSDPNYDPNTNYAYCVTSKQLTLTPETPEASFEINVFDPEMDINAENYTFDIKIVSVKGASVGDLNVTSFTIKDNDADFYDKLSGTWVASLIDYDGNPATQEVRLAAFDEDEEGYNAYYELTGMMTYCNIVVDFYFDKTTKEGRLEAVGGQTVAAGVNFGGSYGVLPVIFGGFDGSYVYPGSDVVFTGEWNETMDQIDWNNDGLSWAFLPKNGSRYLLWDAMDVISFKRK